MGTKNNPGMFDCYAELPPDEPFFVLTGHDKDAQAALQAWINARMTRIGTGERPGSDMDKVREAQSVYVQMRMYEEQYRARAAKQLALPKG